MAGVKGRSGGARPGAGRPRKKTEPVQSAAERLEPQPHGGSLKRSDANPTPIEADNMLEMLQKVALGQVRATSLQVRAAIAAVQYTHVKAGDGGKKDARKEAAAEAARGRLAPKQPPKLVVNNG